MDLITEAGIKNGGNVDSQFIRDIFYQTPGMLDDPLLGADFHDFFIKQMNPSINESVSAAELINRLKPLEGNLMTREQMWHSLKLRDEAAPSTPGAADPPAGPLSSGVARNIHSVETAKRFQTEADGLVRALKDSRRAAQEKYRENFSRRGNPKHTASDINWTVASRDIASHMTTHDVGNFSVASGKERGYTRGFDVPDTRLGVVPNGDAVAMTAAAKAIRSDPAFRGADVRFTPSVDTPGHMDVTASYHFDTLANATAKANEIGVTTVFDSSKKLNPPAEVQVAAIPQHILDAKSAEIASAMNLPPDQAAFATTLLSEMANANARVNGGTPMDYLNRVEFVKGGHRGPAALFQDVAPYLNALEGYGMGVTPGVKEMITASGNRALLNLDQPLSLGDAWLLKMQGINPAELTPAQHASLYDHLFQAQTRPSAGDPVDAFRRAVLSMLSPENPLTNHEVGLAALGIRNFADIERIAAASKDTIINEIKGARAGSKSIGAIAERINRLAKSLVKDPKALDTIAGESATEYLSRMATAHGFNMKTANFMAMLADPAHWPVGTIDVHMVRSLLEGDLATYLKPGELDPALIARYKARKANSKDGRYPQPSARSTKAGKLYEGSDYQKFSDAMNKALDRKYPDSPYGGGGKQWMSWDEGRGRVEPHTAVWPDTSKLPRMTAEELKAAKAVHTGAGYLSRGPVQGMGENAVFFQDSNPARARVAELRQELAQTVDSQGAIIPGQENAARTLQLELEKILADQQGVDWMSPREAMPASAGYSSNTTGHDSCLPLSRARKTCRRFSNEGLHVKHARGDTYGEPNAIWFSTKKPSIGKDYVEVFIDPKELAIGSPAGKVTQAMIADMEAKGSNFSCIQRPYSVKPYCES